MLYSEEKVNHVVDFIRQLKHTKGKWAGQPFELIPWEVDLIKKAFGTLRENGTRQYKRCIQKLERKMENRQSPLPLPFICC